MLDLVWTQREAIFGNLAKNLAKITNTRSCQEYQKTQDLGKKNKKKKLNGGVTFSTKLNCHLNWPTENRKNNELLVKSWKSCQDLGWILPRLAARFGFRWRLKIVDFSHEFRRFCLLQWCFTCLAPINFTILEVLARSCSYGGVGQPDLDMIAKMPDAGKLSGWFCFRRIDSAFQDIYKATEVKQKANNCV